MEVIQSFKIDHDKLLKGFYISRVTNAKTDCIVTLDIRMTEPNRERVMSTGEVHAIEHLGATFLRNERAIMNEIVYFGAMACRTGFYLIFLTKWSTFKITRTLQTMFEFIRDFDGEIPGATAQQCGNYTDMDLIAAKFRALDYLNVLANLKEENYTYPML